MAVRKAFLSSTGRDLAEYRDTVCRAINGLDNWKCVRMEDFGARTRPAETFDDDAVRACDLFIGILGHCYGSIPKEQRTSYTEKEYEAAIANDRPRLMFLAPDDFPVPAHLREDEDHWRRQKAFRSRVQADDLHASFSTPHELAHAVLQAIGNWEEEERQRREEEKRRGRRPIDPVPPAPSIELDGIGKRLLTYPVTYIQELFELLSGPKRFIAKHRAQETLTIERALAFLVFSRLIREAVPPHDTWSLFLSDIFYIIAEVIMYALSLVVAWHVAGGRAKILDYLPIHFYYSAIFSFLRLIGNRISWAILRTIDKHVYKDFMDAVMSGSLTFVLERASNIPVPVLIAFAVGSVFTHALLLGWFVAGWGAYRVLNKVSRRRSLVAALIFLALDVPVSTTLALIASALLASLTG